MTSQIVRPPLPVLRIADLVVADEDLALEVLGVEIDDVGALARERPIGPAHELDPASVDPEMSITAKPASTAQTVHREVRVVPVRGHVGHAIAPRRRCRPDRGASHLRSNREGDLRARRAACPSWSGSRPASSESRRRSPCSTNPRPEPALSDWLAASLRPACATTASTVSASSPRLICPSYRYSSRRAAAGDAPQTPSCPVPPTRRL